MTTLTKSTGTVTLSGAAEKVTLPADYGWVWVKNMSDSNIFAGLSADISEGADGVLTIPAGECGRIQADGFRSVYMLGSGNALVVAQNYADCPFKVGGKGGEIPDLSAYAKTADVPNIKVNSAVNADTVSSLRTSSNYRDIFSTSLDNTHPGWNRKCYAYGRSDDSSSETYIENAPETGLNALWYEVETIGHSNRAYQIAYGCYSHQRKSFIRYMHDSSWSGWKEISTTPIYSRDITVQFSDVVWIHSSAGKYHYIFDVVNVNKILSACIVGYGNFSDTDVVQPFIKETQLGIMNNSEKSNGYVIVRIVYI